MDPVEHTVRVFELIALADDVVRFLLAELERKCREEMGIEYIEIDVSAYAPRMQRTLLELSFLPDAYVPGMVFHNANRWDVIRMMKLNVAWDLGQLELVPTTQPVFDLVTLPFIRRDAQRRIREATTSLPVFQGLSPLEMDFVVRIAVETKLVAGEKLVVNGLCVILEGGLQVNDQSFGPGECFGERLHERIADLPDLDADVLVQWEPGFPGFRRSPAFKAVLERLGIPAYWREHGYPPQCRALGKQDFTCD